MISSPKPKDGEPGKIKCQVGSQAMDEGNFKRSVMPGRAFLVKLFSVSERDLIDAEST